MQRNQWQFYGGISYGVCGGRVGVDTPAGVVLNVIPACTEQAQAAKGCTASLETPGESAPFSALEILVLPN